jgi:hypothetical protein
MRHIKQQSHSEQAEIWFVIQLLSQVQNGGSPKGSSAASLDPLS